jgi:hypothetical protein
MSPSSQKPTRNVKAVLGFLVKAEVDAIFKQQPFELPDGIRDPFAVWRASSEAVRNLRPTPNDLEVRILEEKDFQALKEIKSRSTFARYYEAVDDYQFALVPIHGLLTPQWFADFDYVNELASQVDETSSLEDLLRFTMAEGFVTQPIVNGAQVVFSSVRPDLHVEQIPGVRGVGPGEFEIVLRAGGRPNYIQVAALGNRLMLTNGVHRVCALYFRGHARVPCLIRRVSRIEETGLNLQTTLFRPELLNGPRPAEVADFFDTRVAVPLKMRSMYHVLRIGIGIEAMTVPAIPAPEAAPKKQAAGPNKDPDLAGSGQSKGQAATL